MHYELLYDMKLAIKIWQRESISEAKLIPRFRNIRIQFGPPGICIIENDFASNLREVLSVFFRKFLRHHRHTL